MQERRTNEKRRQLLKSSLFGALASYVGANVVACGGSSGRTGSQTPKPAPSYGPLQEANADGLRLPAGFESRIVARSGEPPLLGTGFNWHTSPDGGATFSTPDRGWIYVSNSEVPNQGGGASALRFDSAGQLIGAYSILTGTTMNCAGGPTPWDTWLSCEEFPAGNVWECDPFGSFNPTRLPALGTFKHEAAAVDPGSGTVFMTEHQTDGRFYRFLPGGMTLAGLPDLTTGSLQVAEVVNGLEGQIRWHDIPDSTGTTVPTRLQVSTSTPFNAGEGLWFDSGSVYMTTAGDNRVWVYDVARNEISIIYDDDFFTDAILLGVDNVTVSPRGDVFVAEDADDLQLVAITPNGDVEPFLQLVGHNLSEVTGPAFDPSGSRLYVSSQRGTTGAGEDGMTFEIRGNFTP